MRSEGNMAMPFQPRQESRRTGGSTSRPGAQGACFLLRRWRRPQKNLDKVASVCYCGGRFEGGCGESVKMDDPRTEEGVTAQATARKISATARAYASAPAVFFVSGSAIRRGSVVTTHADVERGGVEQEGGHDGKWSGEVV
jgi:hypothetical protein